MEIKYEEFDEIISMHRNKSRYVDAISKLWSRSFTILYTKDQAYLKKYRSTLKQELYDLDYVKVERGLCVDAAKGGLMLHQ